MSAPLNYTSELMVRSDRTGGRHASRTLVIGEHQGIFSGTNGCNSNVDVHSAHLGDSYRFFRWDLFYYSFFCLFLKMRTFGCTEVKHHCE